MKTFNPTTIEAVVDYLSKDYSLELEQDKDFLFYYIDVFNVEEPESTDYFQFVISEDHGLGGNRSDEAEYQLISPFPMPITSQPYQPITHTDSP